MNVSTTLIIYTLESEVMKLILAVCFVYILIVENGRTNGTVIGCQCKHNTNLVVYYVTSELRNFSSWNNICNCNDVDSRARSQENGSNSNNVVFSNSELGIGNLVDPSTAIVRNAIKECLNDCSSKFEGTVTSSFDNVKFWLGLQQLCGDRHWRSQKDDSMKVSLHGNKTLCPKDTCEVIEYADGKWEYDIDDCDTNQRGFICEYPYEHELTQPIDEIIQLENCPSGQHADEPTPPESFYTTISPKNIESNTTRPITSSSVQETLKMLLNETRTDKSISLLEANIELHELNEQLKMLLVNNHTIAENILYDTSKYIYQVVDKLEMDNSTCVSTMAETFTQGIIGVIENSFQFANLNSWVNAITRKTTLQNNTVLHPISLTSFLDEGMRKVHQCFDQAQVREIKTSDITVSVFSLPRNLSTFDSVNLSVNVGQEANLVGVKITYSSLAKLLESIQNQILEKSTLQFNTTCMHEFCSNHSVKYYIKESPMLTFSAYKGLEKHSVPINFTLPLNIRGNRNPKQALSCEYFDDSAHTWSSYGCQVELVDNKSVTCVCNHTTNFAILLLDSDISQLVSSKCINYNTLRTLNYICNSCSVLFLFVTITAILIINDSMRKSENEHIVTHLCLSLAALGLFLSLLFGDVAAWHGYYSCIVHAMATHYFILALFSWMTVEGWMLHLYVIQGNIRKTTLGWRKHIVGWGVPLIISIATILAGMLYDEYVYFYDHTSETYSSIDQICVLTNKNGLVWASSGPILFAILLNTYFLIKVLLVIKRLSKESERYRPSISSRDVLQCEESITKQSSVKPNRHQTTMLRGFTKLFPLLGMSWLIGWLPRFFIGSIVGNNCQMYSTVLMILLILHSLINGLLGVFIFIVCVLRDGFVMRNLRRKLKCKKHKNYTGKSYGATNY